VRGFFIAATSMTDKRSDSFPYSFLY